MRLADRFEKSGFFWLPAKPANQLPGVLRIEENGKSTLDIIGVFGETLTELTKTDSTLNRIVGVIENGELVTLDRCFYKNKNISIGGLSKSLIHVNAVLRGAQYDEGEPVTFTKLNFSLEGLDEWLSVTGLRVEHNWIEKSASIHFSPPDEIAAQLSEGISLAFTFAWALPGIPIVKEAKISQKAYITLKSEKPRPLEDFLALVFKINNFFCFAIDQTVSLDSLTGYSNAISTESGDGETNLLPIHVYYQSTLLSEKTPKLDTYRMLFHFRQIENQLEAILNKWLDNYEISEPAFNLYFASKSGGHKYLEGRFLSLAQGLETLHRRNSHETFMPETEFENLVGQIVQTCPIPNQSWLKMKLQYANELTLRQRMRQMIEPFEALYGDSSQRKQFISSVIDTRNYLTHYDNKHSGQVEDAQSLWSLCKKLEVLFQLHFLRLIGLDSTSIENLVKENDEIRWKLKS